MRSHMVINSHGCLSHGCLILFEHKQKTDVKSIGWRYLVLQRMEEPQPATGKMLKLEGGLQRRNSLELFNVMLGIIHKWCNANLEIFWTKLSPLSQQHDIIYGWSFIWKKGKKMHPDVVPKLKKTYLTNKIYFYIFELSSWHIFFLSRFSKDEL